MTIGSSQEIVAAGMGAPDAVTPSKRRALLAACTAHVVHDGYTDLLYVLLPLWKVEFGLGYAAVGLIRATYAGAMATAQVPVDRVTAPFGSRASLVGGTLVAAAGLALAGLSTGLVCLCAALMFAGVGSSTQHPRSSVIVTDAYGSASRGALGIYNFAGDLGKAILPALTSLLLIVMPWREAILVLAGIGVMAALGLCALVPETREPPPATSGPVEAGRPRHGFLVLFAIGALDTATRMGFLLFLPFVLIEKHAGEGMVGAGLALVFAGGALGKGVCGWLGHRVGLVGTVVVTECVTALMIGLVPALPLGAVLALLPLLGVALNGTSSVLYGTVPDVAKDDDVGRAFALFYTGVMGSSALAPVAFGMLADGVGRHASLTAVAATALVTIPLVFVLGHMLKGRGQTA